MPDLAAAHDKLARACQADAPGTAIERWRSTCTMGQLAALLAAGRDVTVVVGRRTDRKSGDFEVVMQEERQ